MNIININIKYFNIKLDKIYLILYNISRNQERGDKNAGKYNYS